MKRFPPNGLRLLKWSGFVLAGLVIVILLLLVFFGWRVGQREKLDYHTALPDTGRLVKAGDIDIFVQEYGPPADQVILITHGTGAWSELWRETIDLLAGAGYRVVAMDVPPFGYSEKPAGPAAYERSRQGQRILDLLDSLEVESAILLSHSVGAHPAMEAVLLAPGRFDHLILVDPALGMSDKGVAEFSQNASAWYLKAAFAVTPLRNAVFASVATNPLLTGQLFRSFVSKKESVTPDKIRVIQAPLQLRDMTTASADWFEQTMIRPDTSLSSDFDNIRALRLPVLLIWGETDTVTPLWQGELLHEAVFANSTLIVIPDTGHIPYLESPAEFHEHLLDYLDNTR